MLSWHFWAHICSPGENLSLFLVFSFCRGGVGYKLNNVIRQNSDIKVKLCWIYKLGGCPRWPDPAKNGFPGPEVTLLQESVPWYKADFFIPRSSNKYVSVSVLALHSQPLGMEPLCLCLHKLRSVKTQLLNVQTAWGTGKLLVKLRAVGWLAAYKKKKGMLNFLKTHCCRSWQHLRSDNVVAPWAHIKTERIN